MLNFIGGTQSVKYLELCNPQVNPLLNLNLIWGSTKILVLSSLYSLYSLSTLLLRCKPFNQISTFQPHQPLCNNDMKMSISKSTHTQTLLGLALTFYISISLSTPYPANTNPT